LHHCFITHQCLCITKTSFQGSFMNSRLVLKWLRLLKHPKISWITLQNEKISFKVLNLAIEQLRALNSLKKRPQIIMLVNRCSNHDFSCLLICVNNCGCVAGSFRNCHMLSVLFFDKAKGYLERAMKLDPTNFDAVYALATILGQQHQYEAAVKLYDNCFLWLFSVNFSLLPFWTLLTDWPLIPVSDLYVIVNNWHCC